MLPFLQTYTSTSAKLLLKQKNKYELTGFKHINVPVPDFQLGMADVGQVSFVLSPHIILHTQVYLCNVKWINDDLRLGHV